jgi:8-oxo-dGTP pyrophosphatase MutT (NUDIX family)
VSVLFRAFRRLLASTGNNRWAYTKTTLVKPINDDKVVAVKNENIIQAFRPQVAALPIRLRADGRGVEIMLITSRETQRWIIPKGWPMKDRKDHQAAAREAFEEAGVAGKMRKRPIGAFTYGKRLLRRVEPCRVMVYVMDVERELPMWPEGGERERRWFSPEAAADQVSEPGLAAMLRSLERDQASAMSEPPGGEAFALSHPVD